MDNSSEQSWYSRNRKKIKIAAYTGIALYTGAIAYMSYDIKKKINEISEKLDILERKVELMGEMVDDLYSMTEKMEDNVMKTKDYVMKLMKLETKQIAGFEQDPEEFAVLGMPMGSHIEGEYRKGGDYKVIKPVRSNKFSLDVPLIKGDVDFIRVHVRKGDFYGEPGEPVEIWLSNEETNILLSGGRIPFQVSALSEIPGTSEYEIKGSFTNAFFDGS